MAVQQRLFNPFDGDPYAERARRARGERLIYGEQLVLDLLTEAGGELEAGVLLRQAGDHGVDSDTLADVVRLLERAKRVSIHMDRILRVA